MFPDPALRRLRRLRDDEAGVAMILALLSVVMLTGIAVTLVSIAIAESRGTATARDSETALHAAEAAVDEVISQIADDPDYTTGPQWPAPADERAWALEQFDDAANDSLHIDTARGGTALGLRPHDAAGDPHDFIIAVGTVPHPGQLADRFRVVKVATTTGIFRPPYAVLTDGELELSGAAGLEIRGDAGNVHTNDDLELTGHPTVEGDATASGSVSGDSNNVGGDILADEPTQPVPSFDARGQYRERHDFSSSSGGSYTGTWFDLCPDDTVREPADSGDPPCTGSLLAALSGNQTFRGWRSQAGEWRQVSNDSYEGIYYVFQRDARVTSRTGPVAMTVIAEADPSDNGGTGSIRLSGAPELSPHLSQLALLADRDLALSGTPGAKLGGFLLAGEQIELGGNTEVQGSVVAADNPHTPKSPVSNSRVHGSVVVEYDEDISLTLPSVVRITDWNEL